MRDVCHQMVHELAQDDERVVFIGSDLSPGLLDEMKMAYPTRHFMEGVAEQNVVGLAAGMAMDGLIPYVNTIATFLIRRAYEQIAIDCCEHDLPVRLIGNGGGLVYAPLGPTHIAFDDIALMRVLPHMTILAPVNSAEMRAAMLTTLHWPHPIYIRLGKPIDEEISPPTFTIGSARLLWRGGEEVLFISTGTISANALAAAKLLEANKIGSTVLHYATVKPFDSVALLSYARDASLVVSVEDHSTIGGLGSAVLEYLSAHRVLVPTLRLGIPDVFPKGYGTQETQLAEFCLQPEQIAFTVKGVRSSDKDRIGGSYRL